MWLEIGLAIGGTIIVPSFGYCVTSILNLNKFRGESELNHKNLNSQVDENERKRVANDKEFFDRINRLEAHAQVLASQIENGNNKFSDAINHLSEAIKDLRHEMNANRSNTARIIKEELEAHRTAIIDRMDLKFQQYDKR